MQTNSIEREKEKLKKIAFFFIKNRIRSTNNNTIFSRLLLYFKYLKTTKNKKSSDFLIKYDRLI